MDGNNAWLANEYSLAFYVDKGVCGAKVYSNVVGKKPKDSVQHCCEFSTREGARGMLRLQKRPAFGGAHGHTVTSSGAACHVPPPLPKTTTNGLISRLCQEYVNFAAKDHKKATSFRGVLVIV